MVTFKTLSILVLCRCATLGVAQCSVLHSAYLIFGERKPMKAIMIVPTMAVKSTKVTSITSLFKIR